MKVLELFAGARSIGKAFEKHGHETTYSVAAISKHRIKNKTTGNLEPISEYAKFCDEVN